VSAARELACASLHSRRWLPGNQHRHRGAICTWASAASVP